MVLAAVAAVELVVVAAAAAAGLPLLSCPSASLALDLLQNYNQSHNDRYTLGQLYLKVQA